MGRFHRVRIVQADSVAFLKNRSRDNGPPSRHSLFCRQIDAGRDRATRDPCCRGLAGAEQAAVLATLLLPHVYSEAVSVFLKSPKVRFQQPKYSLSIQGLRTHCP